MSVSRAVSPLVVGVKRVWLTVGLVFALTATLLMGLPSQAGAVAGYGDVSETNWYTDAVQWSVDNAITDIEGVCFAPETPVSRGETAVWIYNMENQPDAGERHSFTDVTDASQHDAISWMANNEITTGTSPTTFAPDETLRRAQAAAFLHRLAGEPSAPPHNFSDVVAGWQQDPVSWMAHTGITTGTTPTTFAPEDTLTRAQLITFLYRYQGEPDITLDASTPHCDPPDTQVDDSEDWVLHIPPNPVWLEELRAAEAYYYNIRHGGNGDQETMKQMWNELVGDNCDANVDGLCSGVAIGRMYAIYSRRACPRGWSLDTALWYDEQYDSQMCSHPDHPAFYHPSQAYYPPEEADPRGVRRDHWASNATDHWASTSG